MRSISSLLGLLFALVLTAKDPLDWKQGKVVSVSVRPPISSVNVILNSGIQRVFTYGVDGSDKLYLASRKGTRVIVELNSNIQYSLLKGAFYVKDADGKVHKLTLIESTPKQ